jgi:two-component system, response regulator YesN
MRGNRRMWKYGGLFLRFLATLGVLLIATIAALAFVLTSSYERNTLRIIEESHLNLLSQVTFGFNSMDTEARAFASSLFTDNRVIPLLLGKDLDIWEIVKTLDSINVRAQAASFVDSVYIYNARTGEFYTTLGKGIRTTDTFFDPDIAAIVKSGRAFERMRPIPRKIERSAGEFSTAATLDVYTYVLSSGGFEAGVFPSALFVNISVSSLLANLDTLSQARRGDGSRIFVVGPDGRVVADPRQSEFLKDNSRDPLVHRVFSSSASSGSFLAGVDGTPSVVTWISSAPTGWRFIQVTPYAALARPLVAQRTLIIVICAAFLLAAVLLSFIFSRMLYLPIGALVSHVRRVIDSSETVARSENEMRFLSDAFSHTAGMVKILRRFKEDNLQTLRAELLRKLLAGDDAADDVCGRISELELRLAPGGLYHVVACRIDRIPGSSAAGDHHDEIRTYVLERTARALTGVRFDCETVETDRGLFALIVCFEEGRESGAQRDGALRDHVRGLQAWADGTLDVSLSAALCGPGQGLGSVSGLYRQALDLLSYRLVFGRGCLIGPADVEGRNSAGFRFPIEDEKRLLDALKSADSRAARSAFLRIQRDVALQQYETIRLTITRLASSIFDLLTLREENSTLRYPVRFSEFMRTLDQAETLDEMGSAFLLLFLRIEEAQKSQASQKPERNIQAIREIIETHHGDCTLSTTSIAGMMKMSPVYLGKLFRDHIGQSISEYLTGVRMAKARELLTCTDCSVKELARRVGIDNPRFLFAKFKQHYGATPSQYRLRAATQGGIPPAPGGNGSSLGGSP